MNKEKEREYCVYKHTAPNGKVYIGLTCKKPNARWANGYGYKNQMFYNAIQKYGWNNIKHEILFEKLTKSEAEQKEIELIAYYDSTNPNKGYNISLGGASTLGVECSDEKRKKISESHKGKKRSQESIRKQSETTKGHLCSEDTRRKISEANSNRIWTDASKEKLRIANIGKKLTKERREQISEYFKLYSPNKKQVICIETNITYESLNDVERKTGISRKVIGNVCSGIGKTAGGFHWCFLRDYNKNTYIIQSPKTTNKPKNVICLETGKIFESIGEASRQTSVSRQGIIKVCQGEQKTAGKLHWQYYDDYLLVNKGAV